jgi:hypothetical protein
MFQEQIKSYVKQLKATDEYKAVVKRINDEEGD